MKTIKELSSEGHRFAHCDGYKHCKKDILELIDILCEMDKYNKMFFSPKKLKSEIEG